DLGITLQTIGERLATANSLLVRIGGIILDRIGLPAEVDHFVAQGILDGQFEEVTAIQIVSSNDGTQVAEPGMLRHVTGAIKYDEIDWSDYQIANWNRWATPNPKLINLESPEYAWLADFPELSEFMRDHASYLEERDLEKAYGMVHLPREAKILRATQIQTYQNNLQGLLGEIAFREKILKQYQEIIKTDPTAVLIWEHSILVGGSLASDAIIGTIDEARKTIKLQAVYEITTAQSQAASTAIQMEVTTEQRLNRDGLTLIDHNQKGTLKVLQDPDVEFKKEILIHPEDKRQELKSISDHTVNLLLAQMALGASGEAQNVKGKAANRIVPQLMARLIGKIKMQPPETRLQLAALVRDLTNADAKGLTGNHLGWEKIAWAIQVMIEEVSETEYAPFYGKRAFYILDLLKQLDEVIAKSIGRSESYQRFKRCWESQVYQSLVKCETCADLINFFKLGDIESKISELFKAHQGRVPIDGDILYIRSSNSNAFANINIRADGMPEGKLRGNLHISEAVPGDSSASVVVRLNGNGQWIVDGGSARGDKNSVLLSIIRQSSLKFKEKGKLKELAEIREAAQISAWINNENLMAVAQELGETYPPIELYIRGSNDNTFANISIGADGTHGGKLLGTLQISQTAPGDSSASVVVRLNGDGEWLVDGDSARGDKNNVLLSIVRQSSLKFKEKGKLKELAEIREAAQISAWINNENLMAVAQELDETNPPIELYIRGANLSTLRHVNIRADGTTEGKLNGSLQISQTAPGDRSASVVVRLNGDGEWLVDGDSARGKWSNKLLQIIQKSLAASSHDPNNMTPSGMQTSNTLHELGAGLLVGSGTLFRVGTLHGLIGLAQYTGVLPMAELLIHGDFGLGTYHGLDGEMIVVDGVGYQVLPSG
ncbi:MAG: hypothetical protein ACD_73C00745G0001, partial [uncultured bacterium]